MSAITATEADPLSLRPFPERPSYATGQLLDAGDFSAEQTYHRGRLAQSLALTSGGGTLAGLRARHLPGDESTAEEIRIDAGIGVDRLGRLVDVARPACLRLERWWDTQFDSDGDTLVRAAYDNPGRFVSARLAAEAGTGDVPPLPDRAVVADVFLRFVACRRGLTPAFASGPYDALNAVTVSRLRDAYELLLIPRDGLDDDFDGLPVLGPDFAAMADDAARRAALQDAVFAAWPADGRSGDDMPLEPGPEHPTGSDPSSQFLARVLIPVLAGNPPERDLAAAVVVDNGARRFVPSTQLIQRWLNV